MIASGMLEDLSGLSFLLVISIPVNSEMSRRNSLSWRSTLWKTCSQPFVHLEAYLETLQLEARKQPTIRDCVQYGLPNDSDRVRVHAFSPQITPVLFICCRFSFKYFEESERRRSLISWVCNLREFPWTTLPAELLKIFRALEIVSPASFPLPEDVFLK